MYSLILKYFNLSDDDIVNVYPYGSMVYGTNSVTSDHDFIVILNKDIREFALDSDKNINIHIYSVEGFEDQINQHKISALECIFLPKDKLLKSIYNFKFKLNKNLLRSSISEKASHSWVKAKKKFEIEADRDLYIAKKSLFHSLRIIDFGTQIASNSRIVDYTSSNSLWEEIITDPATDWDSYKNKYQNLFNNKMTEFRKVAPK